MFTPEEKTLLAQYVTSTENDVFVIKNLQGIVGAVFARYSRAKGTLRETLLKEFIKEGVIDPKHAEELIARVLIAYGDDSVGELEGAHASIERHSMLVTKEYEDRRINISPIEQSTRYVFYDQKDEEGKWLYWRGPELTESSFGAEYLATMDAIFETYARLVEPMKIFFQKLKPLEEAEYDINGDGKKEKLSELTDEKERKAFAVTYNTDVRTKACDTLRHLLPLSTLTNVGLFGNGRAFQHLLTHLFSTDLPETHEVARQLFEAASEVIPAYVKRASRNEYVVSVRREMFALARELGIDYDKGNIMHEEVKLLPMSSDPASHDIQTVAAMLFPYAALSFGELIEKVSAMSDEARFGIIHTYIGARKSRRDRPGRALEHGYPYTFDMLTDWGVYKDLMRHRMNTQQRQLFTTRLGFFIAPEIKEAGFLADILECVQKAGDLFERIHKENPLLAQYAVLHGNFVRWTMGLNDRALMHLAELRSTPQGHPNYRKIAQEMHKLVAARSSWRGEAMQFVDHSNYYWSRADSEARQRVRERKLEDEKI
ncbi:MAG: FAD-dependent thymidylate synthase [bacterium]|nr:FAD-dependent thymidylate synthase [bacterium]